MSLHPALHTPLCDLLGIDLPIVQAGMGYVGRADLAAAVSAAGALGMIGAASLDAKQLRDEIHKLRDRTDRPFGVDVLFATVGRPQASRPPRASRARSRSGSRSSSARTCRCSPAASAIPARSCRRRTRRA